MKQQPIINKLVKKRLKALVSAYACNPFEGSEKGVGWDWVTAIAQHHDLWVITGELHRADIEQEIAEHPECYRNIRFYYIPRIRWFKLERMWPPAYLWTYKLWQRAAYRLGARLHGVIRFDLVHQLTYVGFRVPGHLWKLDIPFVWGPIGGLENTPWRLLPMLGMKGLVYYAGRNILTSFHKRFLTLPKRAFRKANGGIIAATEGIRREISEWYGHESEVICEVGSFGDLAQDHSIRDTAEPIRMAWSGLHLAGKALHLLLLSVANLPKNVDWRLDILGQGPYTLRWKQLAKEVGIFEKCRWHGWVPRDRALALVRDCHIFTITSLKDLTSTVLMEALSLGVPVICPDHCGFSYVVTESCGIKFQVKSQKQVIKDLSAAIRHLWVNEKKRRELAAGALKRALEFTWEKKAEALNQIYVKVTNNAFSAG